VRAKCRFRRQASKPKQLVTKLHVPATEPAYRLAKTPSALQVFREIRQCGATGRDRLFDLAPEFE
jgi:hypothetical protein